MNQGKIAGRLQRHPLPVVRATIVAPLQDRDAGHEDHGEDDDPDDPDDHLDVATHRGDRINAPNARMEGTQRPTNTPASLSSKNQR